MDCFIKGWILLVLFSGTSRIGEAQRIFHLSAGEVELVYFGNRNSYLVPQVAGTFINAMDFHRRLWDYRGEKSHVILEDFSDIGHGGAIVMPLNQVFLGVEPYNFSFSIIPSNERFQWLFNHELTHVVMGDKANSADLFWRKVMRGKIRSNEKAPLSAFWSYLTVPRWYAPRWYHEGIACFMETWMSGGLGRAMGTYDEMYFRSIVAEKLPLYSLIGLETEGTVIDFQVGANAYLYGTRFVDYLAFRYGVDSLLQFYNRTDDSRAFYASQFRKVFGLPVNKVWKAWIDHENFFQRENIEKIIEYPLTPFIPVTRKALGSFSKYGYNPQTGKIYAAINHPGKISRVVEIDRCSGSIRKICKLDSPALYHSTHLAYDPFREKLFISEQNNHYRSLVEVDIASGRKTTMIPYSRTGDFAFNGKDRNLWGVMHDNGYAVLVKIPAPYTRVIPMYTVDFGKALFDLDISHNGKWLSASLSGIRGEQSLILFDLDSLEQGKKSYRNLYHLEDNTLTQFSFTGDDQYLVGTSYFTGVSNIWRVAVPTGNAELMSNTETGFFMPVQISSDSLMVLKFTRDGMIPGIIPARVIEDANAIDYLGNRVHQKNPVVGEWSLPPAKDPVADTVGVREGTYRVLRSMKLASAYPDVAGFKNTMAAGLRFTIRDPVGFSNLELFLGGSPWSDYAGKQKFHAQATWDLFNWNFHASWNKTDFYDLFGPTHKSRAGYSAGFSWGKRKTMKSPFITDYELGFSTFGELEVLPQYQNIATPIRNLQMATASAGVEKLRKTLGAVDHESGYALSLEGSGILAKGELYPSLVSDNAIGFLIPGIRNTSFWIRNSTGFSLGERTSPLSRFYFGGFRNNYVDWQPAEQYRKSLAFPGVGIDEIEARHYLKNMGELNLKPLRLRNIGLTWLYPVFVKASFFSTHLITDFDNPGVTRNVFNFGTQVDIQLVLFSYMKSTWSAGYAVKKEKGVPDTPQWMFSLKLLGD